VAVVVGEAVGVRVGIAVGLGCVADGDVADGDAAGAAMQALATISAARQTANRLSVFISSFTQKRA
jgi:hypothetical protein